MKSPKWIPLLFLASGCAAFAAHDLSPSTAVETFPLAQVRLLDGPFKHAQDLNGRYLLEHDVDRMVAPYRAEAGLPLKAPKYPNWESSGLDGHTAGHYLTALAQTWAATGEAVYKERLDYMVAELAECQAAQGDGYLGGVPRGRVLWDQIAKGEIDFQNFSLNGAWVPWYNLHKIFAGLRDAWTIAGNAQAKDVLIKFTDWTDRLLANLTDEQFQMMLRTEHGGMNEVLADVAVMAGEPRYFALAERFSHRAILDPLLRHRDELTGLHANTQIPKIIGFARIAELGGDASWRDAARFFWNTVVENRSLAFGGNSEREHFNPTNDFSSLLESREGPESCNTYNMLRLSETLFRNEPAARYADYYERALYNHILASQHPEHGGYVYFTPIRPQHYRVYSQPNICFWCCVGTGMENHGKYGEFIYAHSSDALWVNLFIASELDWPDRGVKVRQETAFPDESRTRLVLSTQKPLRFTVNVRHPSWVGASELRVKINGQLQEALSSPASYLALTREWRDGDTIELELPMHTSVEALPDGSDYVALVHGPIVLAARTGTDDLDGLIAGDGRMAHVSTGAYLPLDQAPMLVGERARLADSVEPVAGKPLTFTAKNLIRPERFQSLTLEPFFRIHDARYVMYWRTVAPENYADVMASIAASEKARLALEARTVDQVSPGEQQPEVEHGFQGTDSRTGVMHGRKWRDAGQWFSYRLNAKSAGPLELIVTYYGDERNRAFDLVANDRVLASVKLTGGQRDRFNDVSYAIPADLLKAANDGTLTVKFVAAEGARTASIFGVRLVRAEAAKK